MIEQKCKYCGFSYTTRYSFSVFCSNKCKISWHNRDKCQNKKEYNRQHAKKYRLNNLQKCKERRKKNYFLNKKRELELSKIWKEKNKKSNREYHRKYCIMWCRKNKEKRRAISLNNKAKRRNAIGKIKKKDIVFKLEIQQNLCYWCMKFCGESYHVDHIVPISKGGSNESKNLCISCPDCNLEKKDKMPQDWVFILRERGIFGFCY